MKRRRSAYSAKVLFKWPGILLVVFAYLAISALVSVLPVTARARRSARIRNTSFFSRIALTLFGVRIHAKHRERLYKAGAGRLLISNHVSYVDVLVLAALQPAVFITSIELKNTFLLGLLARFAGSLFVERRKPAGLKREIREIAFVLKQGFNVALFPEGTTTSGERVHPFKMSLFDAALAAGSPLLPLCLRYTRINDEPVNASNRDSVFYYGGITFSKHFPLFLSLTSIDVEVTALKSIKPDQHASRKELAAAAHDLVCKAYE